MQTAWRTLQEAVRSCIGRDRSEDAEESARCADEDAARAENEGHPLGGGSGGDEGHPLGRTDQADDPDPDPRAPQRTGTAEQPCPTPGVRVASQLRWKTRRVQAPSRPPASVPT
jgi:hypothetical protein